MSRSAPAIPLFGDAYLADTRHLSLEQHGAYLQLMMIAWRSPDCALPDDDAKLARMLGVTPKKWAALKPDVMAFWTLDKTGWQQNRLTKERRFVAKKSEDNRSAANARWNAKSLENNDGDDANALPDECLNDAPPPPHSSKSSEANASGSEAADPLKEMFDLGVAILTSTGTNEKQARSLLGKWRKSKGEAAVIQALIDARSKAVSNPVEWLEMRFKTSKWVSASGYEYRGSDRDVMREAEKRNDMTTYYAIRAHLNASDPPKSREKFVTPALVNQARAEARMTHTNPGRA